MKILITGGTGLIGSEVGRRLVGLGHTVLVVSRSRQKAHEQLCYPAEVVECDLTLNELTADHFSGVQAIVHLAGESIDGRWTEEKKSQILTSRQKATYHLLKNCPSTVQSLICASALGYYGHRGDEELSEDSEKGSGFLAEVCADWERAVQEGFRQRTVWLRFGVVFSRKGGALKKLIGIFQNNVGAVLGSGNQWMSWLSLNDAADLVVESLLNSKMQGVYNACNSVPVTNRQLTEALVHSLQTIQLPPAPVFAVKALLGEMSSLVLDSTRARSVRLSEMGFKFKDLSLADFFINELEPYQKKCSLYMSEQYIPYSIDSVFQFFADEKNLEKITPPFLNFKTERLSTEKIEQGTLIDYRLKIHQVPVRWRTRIEEWNPPHHFVDFQMKGPYSIWRHRHQFTPLGAGTLMQDEVIYQLPIGWAGRLVAGGFVLNDIETIFSYRRKFIAEYKFA